MPSEEFKLKVRAETAAAAKEVEDLSDRMGRLAKEAKAAEDAAAHMGDGIAAGGAKAKKGLDSVGDAGDNSRSVLANLTGNASQDLGELGGVAGSAGVALGQLAEYAVDGNIKLKNLAKVAGPLAAITGVTLGISHALEQVAEAKAWRAEEVEGYTAALQEAYTAVDAVRQKLEEAGKVEFQFMDMDVDITSLLNDAGVSASQFAALVAGGEAKIQAWTDAIEASGVEVKGAGLVAEAARQQVGFLTDAQDAAAVSAEFFETETSNARSAVDKYDDALRDAVSSVEDHEAAEGRAARATADAAEAQRDARDAIRDRIEAENDLRTDLLKGVDTQYDYYAAALEANDALEDYKKVAKDSESTSGDLAKATDDVVRSFADAATAYADQEGAIEGSERAIDLQIQSLGRQQAALQPGSPLWNAVQQYIDLLDSIKTDIETRVRFSTDGRVPVTGGKGTQGGGRQGFAAGEPGPGRGATPLAAAPLTATQLYNPSGNPTLDRILAEGAAQAQAAEMAKRAAEEQKKADEERAQAEQDAADAAEDASDRRRDVWAAQLEFGEITRDEYKALLEGELANEQKYSDDWIAIRRELIGIEKANAEDAQAAAEKAQKAREDAEQAHQDALTAIFEDGVQRRRALDAADEVNDALAELSQADSDYRKATSAEDRAKAAEALQSAQDRAAEALYNRASASAEAAGLDKDTVEWAAAVRAALLGDAANAPVLAEEIARILEGIPVFANGGVMPGPRGEHRLAYVAGGETIVPTHRGGGFGGMVVNLNAPVFGPTHLRAEVANVVRSATRNLRYGSRLIA